MRYARFFLLCGLIIFSATFALAAAISLSSPPDKLVSKNDAVAVSGSAPGLSQVSINGKIIKVASDGKFGAEAVFSPGKNLISVKNGEKAPAIPRRILYLVSFPDLGSGKGYWAQKEIEELATLDIVEGYPDGGFHPAPPVTRGELATWLAKGRRLNAAEKLEVDPFPDVPKEHWRAPYIKAAVDADFISLYQAGTFGIEDAITRAEAAEVMRRYSDLKEVERLSQSPFIDVNEKSTFVNAIAAAKKQGLFKGYSGRGWVFGPEDQLRRGDAALMLARDPLISYDINNLHDWRTGFLAANTRISAAPRIVTVYVTPGKVLADSKTPVEFSAAVTDPAGLDNIDKVTVDLRKLGGPPEALMADDGTNGDTAGGDGTFTAEYVVPEGTEKGEVELAISVSNKSGEHVGGKIFLTVLEPQ